jgi:cytochrome b561
MDTIYPPTSFAKFFSGPPPAIGSICAAFDINQGAVAAEGVGTALEVNPMQLRNSPRGYGAVSLSLHWLTAGFIVLAWLLGTFGDDLPRGAARSAGLLTHIWAGLAIIVLVVLRIAWRLFDPPPPLEPTRFGHWTEVAARLGHFALYGLLIALPAVGVLLQFAPGDALPVFGIVDIASPWVRDRSFAESLKDVHETLANLLMIVVGLHGAAALVHHWLLGDRTLTRMLPGLTR